MGGMFGGGKAQSQRQTPAGALNVQTSIYGSVFPLAYGKNRSPVNLIHYVNFRAIPHTTKQKTGGKGGGKAATNTTYTYKVAFAASFAVGGTGVSVGTVWKNKEKHTAATLGLTVFSGAAGQTAWSYLTGAYPSQAVPYANLGYIASAAFDLGDSPSLPNLNVEILGLLPFNAGTIDDAEPSAIITDYCSSTRHGAGFGQYLADLATGPTSFRTYCVARGIFISPIENNQRNAGVFIKEIADICNSAAVWKNGKLHIIPYGDTAITGNGVTYTPDLTPLYDLTVDDFLFEQNQPPVKHSEKNPSQRFNHVRIEYNARENDYNPLIVEAKDRADIDDNGLRTKAVTQYKCITKRDVARDVAQLQMQRDLFMVNSYAFRLGVRHSLLEPMDYVTITEPDMWLDRLLVRITEVIEQDDAVDIVAEEVSVGIANAPAFNTTAPQGYNQDFNVAPGSSTDPLIMNAPGMLTPTGYEMWLNVSGDTPAYWGGCQVWVSDDDLEYRLVGSIFGPARYGALAANMSAGSADYDTTSVLRVQLYNGELLGGTQEDVDDFRTLLYVGGEWMSYRDATLVSGTTYDVDTFRRAAYGSTRAAHTTGSAVGVIDEATFRLPYDAGNVGKTIYFKLPAFNVFGAALQDLSDCDAYPHTIGASELTAPMNFANVGGNGSNILPDAYSTYEQTSLPVLTLAGGAVCTRDSANKVVGASLKTTGPANAIVFFGTSDNVQLTAGKRYLISAWGRSTNAGNTIKLFIQTSAGTYYSDPLPVAAANTFQRISAVLDMTANTTLVGLAGFIKEQSHDYLIDGVMIEEAVGILNNPSTYVRGSLRTASYVQETEPTGGIYTVGQLWYKPSTKTVYTWNGTAWVLQADQTAAASDLFVLNPNFDQGFENWSQVDAGFYLDNGVNALSGTSAFKFGGLTTFARLLNSRMFRVKPGQVVFVGAMVSNFSATGAAYVSLLFYDIAGTYISERFIPYATALAIASSNWKNVSKKIVVPTGAAIAQISGVTDGHTAGYWGFDNFRVAIVEDFFRGTLSGESLIPNYNFSGNEGEWPNGSFAAKPGDPITDGWYADTNTSVSTFQNSVAFGMEASTADANLRQLFIGDGAVAGALLNASSSATCIAATYDRVPVIPGEKYWVEWVGRVDQANARPAGITFTVYMGLWVFTKDGTSAFAFFGLAGNNVTGVLSGNSVVTMPAGAAYVKGIVGVVWANANGTATTVPWATCHFRAQSLRVRRQATLDDGVITHGTTYGRTANTDLIDDSGVRRIGVNVKGSRIILGGARNSRASIVAGFASVRTATALSANSSGQISVNAHSVEVSGETVSYSAVTNAVTGGTVGVTYVVYTIDPYLDGGTRTYYKQTTILSAQQAGEGAVFIGNVTIPASGSNTGGEGGTGDPGGWCVDIATMLPDGRFLCDLALGDMVECIDVVTGDVGHYPLLAMKFGREECYRLVSENGATIVQSKSAPMDLPNGKTVTTVDMFGRPVYTKTNGTHRVSHVADMQYVGERAVLKPDFGNRMFFAGERAEATIATHNASAKP